MKKLILGLALLTTSIFAAEIKLNENFTLITPDEMVKGSNTFTIQSNIPLHANTKGKIKFKLNYKNSKETVIVRGFFSKSGNNLNGTLNIPRKGNWKADFYIKSPSVKKRFRQNLIIN